MSKSFLFLLLIAIVTITGCQREPRQVARPPTPSDGYFAWEKLPSGQYKQVKKNYFMNKELCRNVIDVLNQMSTQQPPSNWVLSQTTESSFECWPESLNPNEYYRNSSVYSDLPEEVLTGVVHR